MSSVVPEGWSRQKLGDSLIPRPKSKLPSGESNPLGYYDFYVCSHKVLKSFHDEYSSPSILFSTGGEASVHLATERYAFSTDVWATEFEGDICNEYVFRLLEENIRTINYSGFQGSGIKHLDKSFIEKLEFSIPPLPEQKKIASILTSVDEVIENTQKQIDKLQDLKKATMNELLTKGIGHTEFKDSELGRIPKSWEVTTLGKLARFDSGYAFKNRELAEEGIKIVRISNLHKPNFPYWHFASEYKSTWVVEKGDVLFSWAGVANSINIHRYQGERALINQHIYNFKFESEALKEWTFQVMKYLLPKLKESIEGGAGQLHLTKPFIQAIGIVLPTQSERLRILELSGSLDKQINTVERKLAQTQSLKKSLMQDLLTGKVRVTVN